MSITHVLDSSAFLAHALGEPGSAQVTAIWEDSANTVGISALCIVEIKTRLREKISDPSRRTELYDLYRSLVTVLDITEEVAVEAEELRSAGKARLPLADALIAATARLHGAILVHRDEHLAAIPPSRVAQLVLPPRKGSR
ncbi:MAG: PIN domain-containing protein [Opitutaceae bacterium]|nr:PIN domain-containing protein [Opitutaceae bacterium]